MYSPIISFKWEMPQEINTAVKVELQEGRGHGGRQVGRSKVVDEQLEHASRTKRRGRGRRREGRVNFLLLSILGHQW